MSNKNIIEKVLSETNRFQNKSADELREMLDNELKPSSKIDYSLIDELTTAIIETNGNERLTVDVDEKLRQFNSRINNHRRILFPKWAICLSAACVMLFCANCISVFAWDMNIISVVVELTKGGFSVNFNEQPKEIVLSASEDDPYGFKAKLAEYDIEFETPHYIPDGFILTEIETNTNENYANTVRFIYENGRQNFSFTFTKFFDEIPKIGVPSDHYNISETTVNGKPAIVSKEDNQYTITFINDKTSFFMFTQDVPYDECDKIVASIK